MLSFLLKTDCEVIKTFSLWDKIISDYISTSTPKTTAAKPYPGCGVKLSRKYKNDAGITGTVIEGTVVGEGDYPWMAYILHDRNS